MAIVNFFKNKYPNTDFHELNIDEWILKVLGHDKKITELETWKAEHVEEFNELKSIVGSFDDRIDNLDNWKTTHEAEYNRLNDIISGIDGDLSDVNSRLNDALSIANSANNKADANTARISQATNDAIMRDQQLNQTLINLINQAAGGEFVFMNENILAYAQEFRNLPELSAMYSNDLTTGAWYIFDDLEKFTENGYHLIGSEDSSDHCMVRIGNLNMIKFPVTVSLQIGSEVYTGNIMNHTTNPALIDIGDSGSAVVNIIPGQMGAYLDIEISDTQGYLTAIKLENGLVATPFNANTFSEYLKVFRRIIQDVIDTNIYNTERITISGLDCNLAIYDRATYPENPTITKIGDATINYQIVNSEVFGQVTVIGDPTLTIDASDTSKVFQIRIEGDGIEDLPISSLNTDVSWERTMVGSSVIRFPGAINAFYERLTNSNSEVEFLSGLLFGILPAKGLDTTIISFGFSFPLPGNIASLDNIDF